MVVDKNVDILFSVKTMLETFSDYSVITAEDNDNCIKLLKNGLTPDVILLDMGISSAKGFELIDILKQEDKWSSFPILLTVTMINEEFKRTALEKCDGLLEKPIGNKLLIETLNHILKR